MFPRMGTMLRSGRTRNSCAARRGEPVPTRAPSGSVSNVQPAVVQRQSAVAPRGGIARISKPGQGSAGRSLQLWTAKSICPSSSARRIALANTPVWPCCAKSTRWARVVSPWVVMICTSSGWLRCGVRASTTSWVWARARAEPRVPTIKPRVASMEVPVVLVVTVAEEVDEAPG